MTSEPGLIHKDSSGIAMSKRRIKRSAVQLTFSNRKDHIIAFQLQSMNQKFGWPIICKDTLKSIHRNHNNSWDKKAYSSTAKTLFPIISNSLLAHIEPTGSRIMF